MKKHTIKDIKGVGSYDHTCKVHALRETRNYNGDINEHRGRAICDSYLKIRFNEYFTLNNITCKRCLRILELNTVFIKKEEFMI